MGPLLRRQLQKLASRLGVEFVESGEVLLPRLREAAGKLQPELAERLMGVLARIETSLKPSAPRVEVPLVPEEVLKAATGQLFELPRGMTLPKGAVIRFGDKRAEFMGLAGNVAYVVDLSTKNLWRLPAERFEQLIARPPVLVEKLPEPPPVEPAEAAKIIRKASDPETKLLVSPGLPMASEAGTASEIMRSVGWFAAPAGSSSEQIKTQLGGLVVELDQLIAGDPAALQKARLVRIRVPNASLRSDYLKRGLLPADAPPQSYDIYLPSGYVRPMAETLAERAQSLAHVPRPGEQVRWVAPSGTKTATVEGIGPDLVLWGRDPEGILVPVDPLNLAAPHGRVMQPPPPAPAAAVARPRPPEPPRPAVPLAVDRYKALRQELEIWMSENPGRPPEEFPHYQEMKRLEAAITGPAPTKEPKAKSRPRPSPSEPSDFRDDPSRWSLRFVSSAGQTIDGVPIAITQEDEIVIRALDGKLHSVPLERIRESIRFGPTGYVDRYRLPTSALIRGLKRISISDLPEPPERHPIPPAVMRKPKAAATEEQPAAAPKPTPLTSAPETKEEALNRVLSLDYDDIRSGWRLNREALERTFAMAWAARTGSEIPFYQMRFNSPADAFQMATRLQFAYQRGPIHHRLTQHGVVASIDPVTVDAWLAGRKLEIPEVSPGETRLARLTSWIDPRRLDEGLIRLPENMTEAEKAAFRRAAAANLITNPAQVKPGEMIWMPRLSRYVEVAQPKAEEIIGLKAGKYTGLGILDEEEIARLLGLEPGARVASVPEHVLIQAAEKARSKYLFFVLPGDVPGVPDSVEAIDPLEAIMWAVVRRGRPVPGQVAFSPAGQRSYPIYDEVPRVYSDQDLWHFFWYRPREMALTDTTEQAIQERLKQAIQNEAQEAAIAAMTRVRAEEIRDPITRALVTIMPWQEKVRSLVEYAKALSQIQPPRLEPVDLSGAIHVYRVRGSRMLIHVNTRATSPEHPVFWMTDPETGASYRYSRQTKSLMDQMIERATKMKPSG